MRKTAHLLVAGMLAGSAWLACASASGAGPTSRPGEVRADNAGLAVVLPAGFRRVRPANTFEVLSATRKGPAGQVDEAVTFAAIPVKADATLEAFANEIMQRRTLAVRDLKTQPSESLNLAGLAALRQRLSYTYDGVPSVAERVFLLRPIAGEKDVKLGYVVTIETRPALAEQLPALEQGLLRSLRLTELKHPAEAPLDLSAKPVRSGALGLSLRAPINWKLQAGQGHLRCYQVDYLRGGLPYPMLTVLAQPNAGQANSAKQLAQQSTASAKRLLAPEGFRVLREGPARLAGRAAYEVISQAQLKGVSLICVQRHVVTPSRMYVVSLSMPATKPAGVEAMFETLAKSIELLPVQTQPATAPAAKGAGQAASPSSPSRAK